MSALTKKHHTNKSKSLAGLKDSPEGKKWREVSKDIIDELSEIGSVLRGLRIREGLTQNQLADKLGSSVKQSHISEMERGRRTIGKDMAKKLARVLGTSYRMFL